MRKPASASSMSDADRPTPRRSEWARLAPVARRASRRSGRTTSLLQSTDRLSSGRVILCGANSWSPRGRSGQSSCQDRGNAAPWIWFFKNCDRLPKIRTAGRLIERGVGMTDRGLGMRELGFAVAVLLVTTRSDAEETPPPSQGQADAFSAPMPCASKVYCHDGFYARFSSGLGYAALLGEHGSPSPNEAVFSA